MPAGRKPTPEERRQRGKRLAQLIRTEREKQGWSQQLVADRSRIAYATLRKIERAETFDPGFFTVVDLARAMEIGLDQLAGPGRGKR